MATHANPETIAYVGRLAQLDQDDFAADCFWELWCLVWAGIGSQAANDIEFDRATDTVNSLSAQRDERDAARARLAKPTMADVHRAVYDTVRRQLQTTAAGKSLSAWQFDSLLKNVVGNAVYAVADLFQVEE